MPETLGQDPGLGISGVGTTISGSVSGPIGMLTKIGIDGQEAGEIDITTMNNAITNNKYRSFIASLIDAHGATLTLLYQKANMALIQGIIGGANQNWTIVFPDGSTMVIPGFFKKLGTQIPFDNRIEQEATLRFSGAPVFHAGS